MLHLSIVLRAVLKCKSSAVYEKAIMAKLEIVKYYYFNKNKIKMKENCYTYPELLLLILYR